MNFQSSSQFSEIQGNQVDHGFPHELTLGAVVSFVVRGHKQLAQMACFYVPLEPTNRWASSSTSGSQSWATPVTPAGNLGYRDRSRTTCTNGTTRRVVSFVVSSSRVVW